MRSRFSRIVMILLIILISWEIFSLLYFNIVGYNNAFVSWIEYVENAFGYPSLMVSMFFATFLILSWLPLLFMKIIKKREGDSSSFLGSHIKTLFTKIREIACTRIPFFQVNNKKTICLLVTAVALGFAATIYPYLPAINPSSRVLGVDIPFYSEQLGNIYLLKDWDDVFHYLFSETPDRPFSIFLLYTGWRLSGLSTMQAVQFSPLVIAPLLTLSVFFFIIQGGSSRIVAGLTALLTTLSFQVTVPMYGGLIANWIGLIFAYLFLGSSISAARRKSWRLLFVAIMFQSVLYFTHTYTWGASIGIIIVYALMIFINWLKKRDDATPFLMLLPLVIFGLTLNLIRNLTLAFPPESLEVAAIASSYVSFSNLKWFTVFLSYSLGEFMGISLNNPTMWLFAGLGGLYVALNNNEALNRFLLASIFSAAILFFFSNHIVQTRVLLNLPIQLFSVLGLMLLMKILQRTVGEKRARKANLLLLIFFMLNSFNYMIKTQTYLAQTIFFQT